MMPPPSGNSPSTPHMHWHHPLSHAELLSQRQNNTKQLAARWTSQSGSSSLSSSSYLSSSVNWPPSDGHAAAAGSEPVATLKADRAPLTAKYDSHLRRSPPLYSGHSPNSFLPPPAEQLSHPQLRFPHHSYFSNDHSTTTVSKNSQNEQLVDSAQRLCQHHQGQKLLAPPSHHHASGMILTMFSPGSTAASSGMHSPIAQDNEGPLHLLPITDRGGYMAEAAFAESAVQYCDPDGSHGCSISPLAANDRSAADRAVGVEDSAAGILRQGPTCQHQQPPPGVIGSPVHEERAAFASEKLMKFSWRPKTSGSGSRNQPPRQAVPGSSHRGIPPASCKSAADPALLDTAIQQPPPQRDNNAAHPARSNYQQGTPGTRDRGAVTRCAGLSKSRNASWWTSAEWSGTVTPTSASGDHFNQWGSAPSHFPGTTQIAHLTHCRPPRDQEVEQSHQRPVCKVKVTDGDFCDPAPTAKGDNADGRTHLSADYSNRSTKNQYPQQEDLNSVHPRGDGTLGSSGCSGAVASAVGCGESRRQHQVPAKAGGSDDHNAACSSSVSGPPPQQQAASTSLQLRIMKTKLCVHHLHSRCSKGTNCTFAHSVKELRRPPNLFKTRLCINFSHTGSCPKGELCRFAHGEIELREGEPDLGNTCELNQPTAQDSLPATAAAQPPTVRPKSQTAQQENRPGPMHGQNRPQAAADPAAAAMLSSTRSSKTSGAPTQLRNSRKTNQRSVVPREMVKSSTASSCQQQPSRSSKKDRSTNASTTADTDHRCIGMSASASLAISGDASRGAASDSPSMQTSAAVTQSILLSPATPAAVEGLTADHCQQLLHVLEYLDGRLAASPLHPEPEQLDDLRNFSTSRSDGAFPPSSQQINASAARREVEISQNSDTYADSQTALQMLPAVRFENDAFGQRSARTSVGSDDHGQSAVHYLHNNQGGASLASSSTHFASRIPSRTSKGGQQFIRTSASGSHFLSPDFMPTRNSCRLQGFSSGSSGSCSTSIPRSNFHLSSSASSAQAVASPLSLSDISSTMHLLPRTVTSASPYGPSAEGLRELVHSSHLSSASSDHSSSHRASSDARSSFGRQSKTLDGKSIGNGEDQVMKSQFCKTGIEPQTMPRLVLPNASSRSYAKGSPTSPVNRVCPHNISKNEEDALSLKLPNSQLPRDDKNSKRSGPDEDCNAPAAEASPSIVHSRWRSPLIPDETEVSLPPAAPLSAAEQPASTAAWQHGSPRRFSGTGRHYQLLARSSGSRETPTFRRASDLGSAQSSHNIDVPIYESCGEKDGKQNKQLIEIGQSKSMSTVVETPTKLKDERLRRDEDVADAKLLDWWNWSNEASLDDVNPSYDSHVVGRMHDVLLESGVDVSPPVNLSKAMTGARRMAGVAGSDGPTRSDLQPGGWTVGGIGRGGTSDLGGNPDLFLSICSSPDATEGLNGLNQVTEGRGSVNVNNFSGVCPAYRHNHQEYQTVLPSSSFQQSSPLILSPVPGCATRDDAGLHGSERFAENNAFTQGAASSTVWFPDTGASEGDPHLECSPNTAALVALVAALSECGGSSGDNLYDSGEWDQRTNKNSDELLFVSGGLNYGEGRDCCYINSDKDENTNCPCKTTSGDRANIKRMGVMGDGEEDDDDAVNTCAHR